jgi:hypothetical protein
MALTTSDTIAIFEDAEGIDSAARLFKVASLSISFNLESNDDMICLLTLIDNEGNRAGSNIYQMTGTELTGKEASFTTSLATVRAAVEKVLRDRLLAIPANSGKTITYS